MNLIKAAVCFFEGHIIDEHESLVRDVMIDRSNWLCKCHRCGLYVMHDGAMSGRSCTVTEREALKISEAFHAEFHKLDRCCQ